MLRVRKENVISVQDWDKLVVETYGRPYSLQQQSGCMERQRIPITVPGDAFDYANDSITEDAEIEEMGVSFAAWLARNPKKPVNGDKRKWIRDMWWERNFYPDLETIANDLYKRKLLRRGSYVIEIDW